MYSFSHLINHKGLIISIMHIAVRTGEGGREEMGGEGGWEMGGVRGRR